MVTSRALAPAPVRPSRRRLAAGLVGALVVGTLSFVATLAVLPGQPDPLCPPGVEVIRLDDGPVSCAHADETPEGVDLDVRPRTAELLRRVGASEQALEAAEELGLASPQTAAATSPAVACEGDGTSGYRTQAMYVVEAGAPNRFATMKSTLQLWAAGVDDVVNRSAALTGGVRRVRYVTEAGGGGCVASVVNLTVPAGSLASFGSSINAVKALGYDQPNRKYLMWADTSGKGICGIAQTYPYDTDGQGNPNNGAYAQFARVDSPCWGYGNGAEQSSIEAHELVHTLGAVMSTAPHGTRAGHCWDESDTMCYADGGGFAMRQDCSTAREYLLDCNSDDYFSTFPDPGSWLDSHWNAADSRFLIGGGDGSGGGDAGAPSVLGARIGVNNPAVPGLSTQVSVTPLLPAGRTLASVSWKSARTDCVFSTPNQVQSDVTCNALGTSSTTVTATLVDSSGATKTVTSPLTFATGTARPVTAELSIAGQPAPGAASVCTGAQTPVSVRLVDAATGQPIKGLPATLVKAPTGLTPTTSILPATTATGTTVSKQLLSVPTTYTARTTAGTVYAAAAPVSMGTTVGQCSPVLTGSAATLNAWYGDPVAVTGTLTREVGGVSVPVAYAAVRATLTTSTIVSGQPVTKTAILGSATTLVDGTFSLTVKPTASGTLRVQLPVSPAYVATSATIGELTTRVPASAITGAADRTTMAYGQPITVTGSLTKDTGSPVGVSGATVAVRVTAPGRTPTIIGTARTAADGSYRVVVPLRLSGDLSVAYTGSAAVPAATVALGTVSALPWTTALSATTATPTTVTAGQSAALTGTLTRTYGGTTLPAPSIPLTVTVQPTGGTATTVRTTTNSTGGFRLTVVPRVTTTYTVRVAAVTGYTDAAAEPVTITVR